MIISFLRCLVLNLILNQVLYCDILYLRYYQMIYRFGLYLFFICFIIIYRLRFFVYVDFCQCYLNERSQC